MAKRVWVEIYIDIADADWPSGGGAADAVQNAIGHTGAVVECVNLVEEVPG